MNEISRFKFLRERYWFYQNFLSPFFINIRVLCPKNKFKENILSTPVRNYVSRPIQPYYLPTSVIRIENFSKTKKKVEVTKENRKSPFWDFFLLFWASVRIFEPSPSFLFSLNKYFFAMKFFEHFGTVSFV